MHLVCQLCTRQIHSPAEPAKVFDILLDGELLRGTLEDTLVERNQSTEGIVELEYTFLTLPPQLDETVPQQDWCGLAGAACTPAPCTRAGRGQ